MARGDKTIERPRAYFTGTHETIPRGELVTLLRRGKIKSTVRARGFEHDVKTKDLDFNVDNEHATLRFEPPTG
jgi:hypothetical protein